MRRDGDRRAHRQEERHPVTLAHAELDERLGDLRHLPR
jgi:hypothetical protein